MQIGRLRLQLLKEADLTGAYAAVGVARVIERRADGHVVLDRGYVPPVVHTGADPTLASIVRDIHGLLHQRGDALAIRMSQPGPGGIAEIGRFPVAPHHQSFEPLFGTWWRGALHPERLYAGCLELAGSCARTARRGRPALPISGTATTTGRLVRPGGGRHPPVAVHGARAQCHPDVTWRSALLRAPGRLHPRRDILKEGAARAGGQGAAAGRARAGEPAHPRADGPVERIRDLVT